MEIMTFCPTQADDFLPNKLKIVDTCNICSVWHLNNLLNTTLTYACFRVKCVEYYF